jgi:hypothetical protein
MPTFTLSTLSQLVYDGLDNNTLLYASAQVTSVLNEILRRSNLLVGWNQATIPVPGFSVAKQQLYTVPSGIVIPLNVYYEERELEKYSLSKVAQKYRDFAIDLNIWEGQVARWYPIGLTTFGVHPLDANGGALLEVQGVAPIVPLANPDDVVTLNDELAEALVKYARGRIMLKEIGVPFASASEVYKDFIRSMKGMALFESMTFPRYWVESQLEPQEGKGSF